MRFTLDPRRLLPAAVFAASRTGSQPVRTAARSRGRRAAVAVAVGLGVLVSVQVGLGLAVDAEWSPLRDPIYFDKLALFARHPAFTPGSQPPTDKPTTVLLIGSSRTLNAVDARAASARLTAQLGRPTEVFNFGQAGAGPVTNAVYLRRLEQAGVKPDFVLIEIHPVFLAGQHSDPPEARWLLPFRLRPDELPFVRSMGFPAATPATHGPRGYLASVYEYRFLLVDRYAPFLLMHNSRLNGGHESDAFGFARLQDHATLPQQAALMHIAWGQYAHEFGGYRPNGCGVAALRDTLDRCRAAGWKAGLVLMPERGGWETWYDADGLKELDSVTRGLATEYGVPLFDGRRWVTVDQTVDGHHLTGRGADVFTEKLSRDALAPWITQARPTP